MSDQLAPEEAALIHLADQLRANTADIKREITPEWIRSLTPAQQEIIKADLVRLQQTARTVAANIAEHIGELESTDDTPS